MRPVRTPIGGRPRAAAALVVGGVVVTLVLAGAVLFLHAISKLE